MLNGQFLYSVLCTHLFNRCQCACVGGIVYCGGVFFLFFSGSTPESNLSLNASSGFFCSACFLSGLFIPLLDLPFAGSSAFQPCI